MALKILTVFLLQSVLIYSYDVTVTTKLGDIIGKYEEIPVRPSKKTIISFLGIPYAQPPVGDLRFRKPVPYGNFTTPFKAMEFGASCPQFWPGLTSKVQDEDCLFLNIFSPVGSGTNVKYSVMVFIHGGGFIIGDGRSQTYGKLAAFGDLIVITLNYRLGPLGFLTSGDSFARGNFGLWDQHLALKWVNENIESFGGDTKKVTIFGQSAGGVSVIFQALYPGNKGLFQRVISQSGTANTGWAMLTDANSKTTEFSKRFNCDEFYSEALLTCLRNINDTTEMAKKSYISFFIDGSVDWTPVVDGDFVTQERVDALKLPSNSAPIELFQNISVIMGNTGLEGQQFVIPGTPLHSAGINSSYTIEDLKSVIRTFIPRTLKAVMGYELDKSIVDDIVYQYSNFQSPNDKNVHIQKAIDVITDAGYFIPVLTAVLNHARDNTKSSTYQYEFNELNPLRPHDPWVDGALHGDDLQYVFGSVYDVGVSKNLPQPQLDSQWRLSSIMMTYWINFAKSGDPNKPLTPEVIWKPFDDKDRSYLYLSSAEIKNYQYLHAERAVFWLEYIPKILKRAEEERENMKELMRKEDCINSGSVLFGSIILIFSSIISFDIYF
ncbi:hypothetical protein LOTGIDRAFT_154015 [Lottia gigantea]|uniref:Carboxylic ester hydrolase n=1 Tax=Lottia gigantea TaxID=225164 RepID=V3ZX52_LOTGI|nr:hypothetical protein LOTGIDRAFT_154015 [Lottia gigantea]ESO88947.1 hypothetical protein LOTGIDRAFT_154015 [Lottia gigantea]